MISNQSSRLLVSGDRGPFLLVAKLSGKGFMTAEFFGELFFWVDKRNSGKQQQQGNPKPSLQCCLLDPFSRMQRKKASQKSPTQPLFPMVKETPFRPLAESLEGTARLKWTENWKFSLRHVFQRGGLIRLG